MSLPESLVSAMSSIDFSKHPTVLIIGRSRSGKSTLVQEILKVHLSDRKTVTFSDESKGLEMNEENLRDFIGFLRFQEEDIACVIDDCRPTANLADLLGTARHRKCTILHACQGAPAMVKENADHIIEL